MLVLGLDPGCSRADSAQIKQVCPAVTIGRFLGRTDEARDVRGPRVVALQQFQVWTLYVGTLLWLHGSLVEDPCANRRNQPCLSATALAIVLAIATTSAP